MKHRHIINKHKMS